MASVGTTLMLVAMELVNREPVRLCPAGNTSSLAKEAGNEGLYHMLVHACCYDDSSVSHQDD